MIAFTAFLVPIAYLPFTPADTSRWMLLAVLVPLICINRGRLTTASVVCGLWVVYGALSLLWTPAFWPGVDSVWQFFLLTALVYIGADIEDMTPVMTAFAAGVSINGIVAILQQFGFEGVLQTSGPAGLLVNKNLLAQIGLLGLLCCLYIPRRMGLVFLPFCFAAWILPGSFGAYGAGALVVLVAAYRHLTFPLKPLLLGVFGAGLAWVAFQVWQVNPRAALWSDVVGGLTIFGHGLGSFWSVYPDLAQSPIPAAYTYLIQPVTAHNDLLTLLSDTGVGVILLIPLAFLVKSSRGVEYLLVAFLGLGIFNAVLFNPAAAFLAALSVGFVCRRRIDVFLPQWLLQLEIRTRNWAAGTVQAVARPYRGNGSVSADEFKGVPKNSGCHAELIRRGESTGSTDFYTPWFTQ